MPRLDVWLVENGFFHSRQAAKRAIKAGFVLVDDVVAKASKHVTGHERIVILDKAEVSTLGFGKLKAINDLLESNILQSGISVLDIGTSAGGFFRFALERGAYVTGIEVSSEFLPSILNLVETFERAELIIADAFKVKPQEILGIRKFDLLLVDVTTDLMGTTVLVNKYGKMVKGGGHVVCAIKASLSDEIIHTMQKELSRSFDIIDVIDLNEGRTEIHVILTRRYVFN